MWHFVFPFQKAIRCYRLFLCGKSWYNILGFDSRGLVFICIIVISLLCKLQRVLNLSLAFLLAFNRISFTNMTLYCSGSERQIYLLLFIIFLSLNYWLPWFSWLYGYVVFYFEHWIELTLTAYFAWKIYIERQLLKWKACLDLDWSWHRNISWTLGWSVGLMVRKCKCS